MRGLGWFCASVALAVLGCSATESKSVEEHGRALFHSSSLSESKLNRFACSTCHDAADRAGPERKPGAPLAGATLRPSFWGGQQNDLLLAVEACRRYFMRAAEPLPASSTPAEALYAFLKSLEPGDPEPVPFAVVRTVVDVPRGDAVRGSALYAAACRSCHGRARSGDGRSTPLAPALPGDTLAAHPDYSAREVRLVFVEKTRHGPFLGYGGSMPPFSREVLSDDELGNILEFLGVLGQ